MMVTLAPVLPRTRWGMAPPVAAFAGLADRAALPAAAVERKVRRRMNPIVVLWWQGWTGQEACPTGCGTRPGFPRPRTGSDGWEHPESRSAPALGSGGPARTTRG